MPKFAQIPLIVGLVALLLPPTATSLGAAKPKKVHKEGGFTINTNYPGGNISIISIKDNVINFEPDLRGGRAWFYWNFEITSKKDGDVTFDVESGSPYMGLVGFQGPAISYDKGKTWDWYGGETVGNKNRQFSVKLKKGQTIRLASTFPYGQRDLDAFLKKNRSNRNLKVSTLAKTKMGRKVELLTIGKPGKGKKAVLFTCRHHACESMASYFLEGFMKEALSSSKFGVEFRKKYVLYVVPIVDKDGVVLGDQGKNRRPHDHNRDYTDSPIYPEVAAIKKLSAAKKIDIALDWHCPTLTMDIHQGIYFPGPKDKPANNYNIVSQFAELLKSEMPSTGPRWCKVTMKDWVKRRKTHFSDYFAMQDRTIMAATIEIPYAPKGKNMDPASCRSYGKPLISAWLKTNFTQQ